MLAYWIVLAYLLFPVICSVIIWVGYLTTQNIQKAILYSLLLAVIFGIAGYCFKNPATDPDLVRYLAILSTYQNKNLWESINTAYNNLYAVDVIFWVIADLGNPQLLPAFACFVYYFIVLYILVDYKIKSKINTLYFTLYTLLTICATNFVSIVNGIRWPLAYAMFFLAIYRDLYKNKLNSFTYFLYLASFFMHFSTIGLIFIRLLMIIKSKKIIILSSSGMVFLPHVLSLLAQKLNGGYTSNGLFNKIIYFIIRGNMYFQWSGGGWADTVRRSNYYRIEKYYYIMICIFSIYIILRYYHNMMMRNKTLANVKPLYIFMFTYMILTAVSFSISSHVYIRFISPAIPIMELFYFDVYVKDNSHYYRVRFEQLFCQIFLIGSIIMGIIINLYFLNTMIPLEKFVESMLTFNFLYS